MYRVAGPLALLGGPLASPVARSAWCWSAPTWWTAAVVLLCATAVPTSAQGRGQSVEAGALVFGSKGCVACHAINGMGGREGPDFGQSARPRSFYDFGASMWNHLPQMVSRMRELGVEPPRLRTRETADLVAFLFALNYFDQPGDVAAGERLFTVKRCVLCHQVSGRGGVIGPDLDYLSQSHSPIQVAAAMWNHGPAMIRVLQERRISRPTFSGDELNDLLAYLSAATPRGEERPVYVIPGRAEAGRVLFTEKRCIECHRVRGLGGSLGPELANQALTKSLSDFAAAMWSKTPRMLEAMQASDIEPPQLAPSEMADLVAYLHSVQYYSLTGGAERGQRVVRSRGCLRCHALYGSGGSRAGDLARARGLSSPAAVVTALWNHGAAVTIEGTVAWPTMTTREIADLTAFLQALGTDR